MSFGVDASNLAYFFASQGESASHGLINSTTVTISIALAALIISIILPLYLDGRQSPRVSVRISRLVFFDQNMDASEECVISAINHGRSQVQINQVNISYIKKGWDHTEVFLPFTDFNRSPELPCTLTPYSDIAFYFPQSFISTRLKNVEHYKLYGSLNLSSGYRVVSRKGLVLRGKSSLSRQYPRLRHLRIIVFGKERSRWR